MGNIRKKEEIVKERMELVREYQTLQSRTDPEAKKRLDGLEARARETEQELALLNKASLPRKTVGVIVGAAAAMLIVLVAWLVLIPKQQVVRMTLASIMVPAAPVAVRTPVTPAESTTPGPVVPAVSGVSGVPEIAIVEKGEGIEHVIICQLLIRLVDDPKQKLVFVNDKGKKVDLSYKGDLNDEKTIRKWAGETADIIAVLCGYVDHKTGNEIRVKAPGIVAYVLIIGDEGELKGVKECPGKDGQFQTTPETTKFQQLAKSDGEAKFKCCVGVEVEGGIQPYEYFWTPQMVGEG